MADSNTRGGTHDQHVKAGEQSHKNTGSTKASHDENTTSREKSSTQGGTHEQHVKAGQQSHKNS
jgi:hypothetical protein